MQRRGAFICHNCDIERHFVAMINAGPPLVSLLPSMTTPPGRDVVLQCDVSGFPPPTSILWSRIAQPLPSTSVSTDSSLHLFSVSSGDAGTYECTASNGVGTASAQQVLTVLGELGGRDLYSSYGRVPWLCSNQENNF